MGVGFFIAQLTLRSRPAPDITGQVHQDLSFTLLAVHLKSGQVPIHLDFFFFFTPYIHSFVIDTCPDINNKMLNKNSLTNAKKKRAKFPNQI